MAKKTKKARSFVSWLLSSFMISIILMGIILSVVTGIFLYLRTNADYQQIAEASTIHIASQFETLAEGDYSYDEATGKFYKGDVEITDEFFKIAQKDNENIVHTIFWDNTRVMSDVIDDKGQSVVGTKLTDTKILDTVRDEGVFTDNNVKIYGTLYTVSYYALKNGNDAVAMIFVGVKQEEANKIVNQNVGACIAIVVVLTAINIISLGLLTTKKAKEFDVALDNVALLTTDKKSTVTDMGKQTVANMEQIDEAIEQVSQAVTEQASHTEEIMGSMTDFGDNLDRIIENVKNTNKIIRGSMDSVEELQAQLNELENVSKENSNEIVHISKQIEDDSNAVLGIGKIIDVINDIAFQITILSFNASVEAARAGEAGKGFAVVADSIKELSDKTKASLEDITNIVQEVNVKMDETSAASSVLSEKNEDVIRALNDTKQGLEEVSHAFDQIVTNITGVMDQSEGIVVTKNQVIETVSSLAAASEENAAMSEEIKATSDEVIESTHVLLQEISRLEEVSNIVNDAKAMFMEDKYKK